MTRRRLGRVGMPSHRERCRSMSLSRWGGMRGPGRAGTARGRATRSGRRRWDRTGEQVAERIGRSLGELAVVPAVHRRLARVAQTASALRPDAEERAARQFEKLQEPLTTLAD